jgi:hypothetical protein
MAYSRTELETIGEAFTANALLEWSGRILTSSHEDIGRLRLRGITPDQLQEIEAARLDVGRLKELRKRERRPDPPLARARKKAIEEAIDWRLELRGLAQAVFDSEPRLLERFRPGIKVSRSVPLLAAELATLLAAVKETADSMKDVGVTEQFVFRGEDIRRRLEESARRMEDERSLTAGTSLDLNFSKGVLYTRVRFLCRVARVEFRREPARAALYGYALLRRATRAPDVAISSFRGA